MGCYEMLCCRADHERDDLCSITKGTVMGKECVFAAWAKWLVAFEGERHLLERPAVEQVTVLI